MLYTKEKLDQFKQRWTTSRGKSLLKIIKKSHCYLSPVLFRQKVHNFPGLNDQEVEDGIDLRGGPLAGFDFRVSIQGDDLYSEDMALLSNIHFEGANLKHSNLENGKLLNCFFEGCDLSHAELKNSTLNNCHFEQTDLTGANIQNAKLINCFFADASLKDVTMDNTIVDQKTTFGKELKSEKEDSYHFASIEYKQIKEMYKNSSLHQEADYYHYKEMVSKRKIFPKTHPKRFISFVFGDLLCKYGTSFIRVFLWSLGIVVISATLFYLQDSLLFLNSKVQTSFLDALYFSMVTFTTLGYGDYHAIGLLRFVAGFESFIGASLMSLFTVIVARNVVRD